MSDIVERLRHHVISRGGPRFENGTWDMMLEAADKIERLIERNDEHEARYDALEVLADHWRDEYLTASADAMKFIAERDRLRAALRQIASCQSVHAGDVVDLARRALEGKENG